MLTRPIGTADEINRQCGMLIADLLGMEMTFENGEYEKQSEFLGKQTVFSGLSDHHIMPSGWWHAASGICFTGNTGGLKEDKFYNLMHGHRINAEDSNNSSI